MLYVRAEPFSHGQNTAAARTNMTLGGVIWDLNHGIGAVRYRKHGFTSVDAPASFNGWWQEQNRYTLPQFTTKPIALPHGCKALQVFANVQTAAAGSVYIAIEGMINATLNHSQPIQGNSVRRAASWPAIDQEVCAKGSVARSGHDHQGNVCTNCNFETTTEGVCGGAYPHPLRCNTTADCHAIDDGTCHGEISACNASGICADPGSNTTLVVRKRPTESDAGAHSSPSVVAVPKGIESVTLTVALVAAKLFSLEVECVRV